MEETASEEHVHIVQESALPTDDKVQETDDTAAEQPTAENLLPVKPKPKLCGICENEDAKYKCPRCSLP